MGKYTKAQAIKIVTSCAQTYRDELADRTLLFVCQNQKKETVCFEFTFQKNNFMHLTGLKTKLSATDFYERCLVHKLRTSDFEFAEDGTTNLKLDILPSLLCKNLSASMIGDYSHEKPKLYTEKIAGGVHACMGFVSDRRGGKYVPNTVLKTDIRDCTEHRMRVIAAYRKGREESEYREMTYVARKINWAEIEYPAAYQAVPKPEQLVETPV